MKTKINKMIKKAVSFLSVVMLLVTACFVLGTESKAAEGDVDRTDKGVCYVTYASKDCKLGEAPAYSKADEDTGYLFGGWFTKNAETGKYKPIKNGDTVPSGTVYAKFVPAYVLSVKCQNFAGTTSDSTSTNLRILSSIDSLNYAEIGFKVTQLKKSANGQYESVALTVPADAEQKSQQAYTGLDVYKEQGAKEHKSYSPDVVFGEASKYLTAGVVQDISHDAFANIISITPYWKTMDGTTVCGLVKYAHVEDGINSYLNVPVNLKNANAVAAGMLSVNYDETKLELLDQEYGIFEEMEYSNNQKDGIIKFVGNVKDVSSGDKTSDSVYVNIRFKINVAEIQSGDVAEFDFKVTGESFTNLEEALFTSEKTDSGKYDVWNIKASILY